MKPPIIVIAFVLCIFMIFSGCKESENQQEAIKIIQLDELPLEYAPQKTRIFADSLLINIPGKDGMKLPEIITAEVPDNEYFQNINEIFPGVSFLPQSEEEKRDGVLPVKSKKPELVKIDFSKLSNGDSIEKQPPIITEVSKPLFLNRDSLLTFEKKSIERELITIQHEDTIYPPLSMHASRPEQIRALAMGHKDYAIFDIRFLDSDQDLPNSFIRAIARDNQGIMWFGTHTGGLVSYDGQYFNQYKMSNGLSSDMIISLLIDKNDNLWVGTQDGGVVYFNGKEIVRYTKKQGLPSNRIQAIIEDSKGNIWFATAKGVSSFNGETISTYTTKQGLCNNAISSLCEDDYGNIWLGTFGGGVSKFDGHNFTNFTEKDGLALDVILSIDQDHKGNIWFGTYGGGVSMFDGDSFTNYSMAQGLGNNTILSIVEDSYDNIWFGTFGNGVTRFNGSTFSHYTTKEGLIDNYVRTLYDDDNGNLWIGTDGGGLSNFNVNSFTHFTTDQGLSNNLVLSILQDSSNRLWFGIFQGGLMVYEESTSPLQKGTFTHIDTHHGLCADIVSSIIQDDENNFWITTYEGGVSMLDHKSFESGSILFTNYSEKQGLNSNIVRSVIQDKAGNIWFGTEGGVTKFDGDSFVTITKKDGLGSDLVSCVFQDRDENLWFGTIDGGVSCYKNDTLIRYTTDQGFGDNTIWTIAQDHNGIIWFGTNGGGLTFFNGESFRTLKAEEGLSNNYVFSLKMDNDNSLWVGTTRGLNEIKLPDSSSYDENTIMEMKPVIINYGKMDGLKSTDFFTNSVLYDNKNRLWWGTGKALSMLELDTYKSPSEIPDIHIMGLTINDRKINFSEFNSDKSNIPSGVNFSGVLPFSGIPNDLSLPYNLNHIVFQFVATDWSAPHQIQYQYKLIGFDNGWSLLSKDNMADYRNIPFGHYTFLVRAIGKSDNWSTTLEYPFIIRWPWWQTWWAILIYVIAFGLIIWLIISWRVNIVKKQKILLENLIFDRTRELDNARKLAEQATVAKSQFIATISHEIRTPLNAIVGLTHLVTNTSLDPKQKDYLQKIDRSAVTLLSLINEILDFSKIEAGKMELEKVNFDLEMVLNSIIILNAQRASEKNLEFVVNINPLVPRLLIGDPIRIGQIITNLCSNAIKFTKHGEVIINVNIGKKISNKELYLQVSVVDTGIGISKEQIPFLFDEFKQADNSITRKYGGTGLGLAISKSMVEMMDGNIWLESNISEGTTFFFDCKVGVQPEENPVTQIITKELNELTILVCDDNLSALASLFSILRSFSLTADKVTSGEEVLAQLEEKPYDLLLIDMHLSGISGLDTIYSIQRNRDFQVKKIILISDTEISKENLEPGNSRIDGYLSKPFLPSDVHEKILDICVGKEVSHKSNPEDVRLKQIQKAISGRRILLVEDNDLNRQVIVKLVERMGAIVDSAENGEIAIEKTLKNSYDLILMDIHMPVMDGYNASKQIRLHNINTPIIAITADAIPAIKSKCKEVGIDDIITKPINPDILYDSLLKWISVNSDNEGFVTLSLETDIKLSEIVIPDLDIQSGIRRFGDNEDFYKKMLRKFIFSNNQTCVKLQELINKKDFEEAHLLIHTLKGESGNIGAEKVSKLSRQVELSLLSKDVVGIDKEIELLDTSLNEISMALNKYFKDASVISDIDNHMVQELIKKLSEYLNLKNPKAFDIIDELSLMGIGKPDIDAINNAVNKDDIEKAVLLLDKLYDSFS